MGDMMDRSTSGRRRDVRRVTFVLPQVGGAQQQCSGHCSGINAMCVLKQPADSGSLMRLWTASRDSLVKVWDCNGTQSVESAVCVGEYEGHIDWVNDVVVVNRDLVATCSSDCTVRVWSDQLHGSLECYSGHSDYVTGLCCPESDDARLFSCGLLGEVFQWDLSGGKRKPVESLSKKDVGSNSVYSIACDVSGNLVSAGSASGVVYMMDTRTGRVEFELMGHGDTVRDVVMSSDGSTLVSGSSDHTVKVWDTKQRRCIHTLAMHTDSVWCIEKVDSDARVIFSAGKDGCVYKTDTRDLMCDLVVREKTPVTALSAGHGFGAVWVGTEESSVRCYSDAEDIDESRACTVGSLPSLRSRKIFESTGDCHPLPTCSDASVTIPGIPAIVDVNLLTDKLHVLSKDSEGHVGLWDVAKACKIKEFGVCDFVEKQREMFDPTQSALTWFQPDSSLGVVAGHLTPSNCFSCETYTRQLGYENAPADEKVNLAEQMLNILFSRWKKAKTQGSDEDMTFNLDDDGSTSVFKFADGVSPAVMVCGDDHSVPWKKSCWEMDGSEDVPEWVVRCIMRHEYPVSKQLKMSFVLMPLKGSNLPSMSQSRLTAPRVLQVQKMVEYVAKRLEGKGYECSKEPIYWSQNEDKGPKKSPSKKKKHFIVLTCNGMTVPWDFTLAAVRQWMWKRPEDLHIEYSFRSSSDSIVLPKIKIPI